MVMNIINLEEKEDRVLNIIKARYGLKNKSDAVALVVKIYTESFLEPELRPDYVKKIEKLKKEKGIPFKTIKELRKIVEG